MRIIRTFILRLLVDADEPQVLRGAVRCVADEDEEHPFTDEQALLTLLRRLGRAPEESTGNKPEGRR